MKNFSSKNILGNGASSGRNSAGKNLWKKVFQGFFQGLPKDWRISRFYVTSALGALSK